jgi:hypothetical protein
MGEFDWRSFLKRWKQEVLSSPDAARLDLPPEITKTGWLGYPGASDEQIAAAEARLAVTLPPSYKAFLKETNGWRETGGSTGRLLAVEEIDWFQLKHPEWIDVWMSGWMAGGLDIALDEDKPVQGEVDYRHLDQTLAISEVGDESIMLLNHAVQTPDGEWQAWLFANWLPGAAPHHSFQAMLEEEFAALRHINREEAQRLRPGDSAEVVAAKLPGLIAALQDKVELYRHLADQAGFGGDEYQRGTADGLAAVVERVLGLSAQNGDPSVLRAELREMAAELEQDASQIENEMRASMDAADLLTPLLNPSGHSLSEMLNRISHMAVSIYTGGTAQGKRGGAGIIRWFLNDE